MRIQVVWSLGPGTGLQDPLELLEGQEHLYSANEMTHDWLLGQFTMGGWSPEISSPTLAWGRGLETDFSHVASDFLNHV